MSTYINLWKFCYELRHRYCAFIVILLLNSVVHANEISSPAIEQAANSEETVLSKATDILGKGKFSEKYRFIEEVSQHENKTLVSQLFQQLLNGQLYYNKRSHTLAQIIKNEEGFRLSAWKEPSALSSPQSVNAIKGYKKVRINNKIRGAIRNQLLIFGVQSQDDKTREQAIKSILKKPSASAFAAVKEARDQEQNSDIQSLMDTVLAIETLKSADNDEISQAINTLKHSIEPSVLNALRTFSETTENDGHKNQALSAIKKIEGKHGFYKGVETLYFGLSLGSVLVLAGIGLAITFGVMGVINMAHGELIMIGAYTTFVIQQLMPNLSGLSILVAIPAAFLVSACVGIVMERLVISRLYGRPLETLLATFGISLILQQLVRTIFSPLNRTVVTPEWMSGMVEINSVLSLTLNRLYVIIFCLVFFFMLLRFMKKSALGLNVRAVSQNRMMARAMGVHSTRVDILTFGLGSGIAGVAGVALSLLTNVGPNLGQAYIIDSFIVVVFGGVGNLLGTLVAGLSLGVFSKILEPWSGAVLAKIIILVFIVLFIQKRPQGLFPQRGRAAEG